MASTQAFKYKVFDLLRWVYSLLSSGLLSSAPTPPSNNDSIFSETGTNKDVSGGLGVELLDEKFLKQIPVAACCFFCTDTTPVDAWLCPAQVQAALELMWRWSRESNNEQRVADMAASRLSAVLVSPLDDKRTKSVIASAPYCSPVERFKWHTTNFYRGRSTLLSCYHNVGKDPLLCRRSQICLFKIRTLKYLSRD